ncbi:uncharacterized protein LOC129231321 isoform X2 [Uloborus diversus]|nr:uncharacterized protein LOC129231321 isoform X2 [Uloborus diversus]
MKAHPDFKWYKLPAPPTRTLITRPSNRGLPNQYEKSSHSSDNCGITLGKLVDDEQLGGLSSLISSSVPGSVPASSNISNVLNSAMAQKSSKNILKPPKKRYIVNGQFKCVSETNVDSRDFQTRNACSALLELAEICTSSAARESSTLALDSSNELTEGKYSEPLTGSNNFKYQFGCSDSADRPKTASLTHPMLCSLQETNEHSKKLPISVPLNTEVNAIHRTENAFSHQDQPLDLCKNRGKTITTSHQQLIDHFVDKFLCDKPLPQSSYCKSSIIDADFCKMFSDKSASDLYHTKDEKPNHSGFTLSVAIESAVDKAYSKDSAKSNDFEVPESSRAILEHITRGNCDEPLKLEKMQEKLPDEKKELKSSNQNVECANQSQCTELNMKNNLDSNLKSDIISPVNINNNEKQVKETFSNVHENSSSNFFRKVITPPKKSRVWCNIFMNEQMMQNKNSNNKSQTLNPIVPTLPPARRSSQRTCKGRRYQALITEGLLQSAKERKSNSNKKSPPSQDKMKNKPNSVAENHILSSVKKKRKKEAVDKNRNVKTEELEVEKGLFNLEEKIASLPKCNFEHLNKKKKIMLETNSNSIKIENSNVFASTSSTDNHTSSFINEWQNISSSGRYKTGGFDLEQEIASLPKCNFDLLAKRKKKD